MGKGIASCAKYFFFPPFWFFYTPVMSLQNAVYQEWATCTKKELHEHLGRQIAGCRTVLDEVHNAICFPQDRSDIFSLGIFLARMHSDLYKYCVKTFYLYRQFDPHHALKLAPRVFVQLFTGEILDLIDEICRQSFFVDSRIHVRKSMYVLLKVLREIKMHVQDYLVDRNYWQSRQGDDN